MNHGTVLIYSSHNRGHYIHERFMAGRALGGWGNKRIMFLPFSERGDMGSQEFAWGNFEWFFNQYRHAGLEAFPFFWRPNMRHHDVNQLWFHLATAEVVILGGGHSHTGLERYKALGAQWDGEWGKFGRILHERQQRGLMTVGYSAGADQLGERLYRAVSSGAAYNDGFGLARNVMTRLHHDSSENGDLAWGASRFPRERFFGLPNDSGLHVDQGVLPSGNLWQVIEFVIDNSWNDPSDSHHVKTVHGARIEHFGPNGRHWSFGGGDHLVRVRSPDFSFDESWILTGGQTLHYGTLHRDGYLGIEHLLASH